MTERTRPTWSIIQKAIKPKNWPRTVTTNARRDNKKLMCYKWLSQKPFKIRYCNLSDTLANFMTNAFSIPRMGLVDTESALRSYGSDLRLQVYRRTRVRNAKYLKKLSFKSLVFLVPILQMYRKQKKSHWFIHLPKLIHSTFFIVITEIRK